MNRDRRRRLRAVIERASELQEQLNAIAEDEQEALDNMPESLQETERYSSMEENVEAITDAMDSLGEIIERLGELT